MMRIHKAIEHNMGQRVFFEFGSCVILQQAKFCAVIKTAFAAILPKLFRLLIKKCRACKSHSL